MKTSRGDCATVRGALLRTLGILTVASGSWFLSMAEKAEAAVITNYLGAGYLEFFNLAINVGDTVVWVQQQSIFSAIVESYGGEWKSPPLSSVGDSFSYTFTNAGFYAYSTGDPSPGRTAGAITVRSWEGAPPAVTINSPPDGSILPAPTIPQPAIPLLGSVTNPAGIAQVQFFAGTNLIGVATNPPYLVQWTSATVGQYVLVAQAVDQQGMTAASDPVNVQVISLNGTRGMFWGPRLIAGGKLLLFYNAGPTRNQIYSGTDPSQPIPYHWTGRVTITGSGAWVDESLPGPQSQFYVIAY